MRLIVLFLLLLVPSIANAQRWVPVKQPVAQPAAKTPVSEPIKVVEESTIHEPIAQIEATPPTDAARPGEVDMMEVKRWGNRVSEVGTGIRSADDAMHSMALQVPVDDSDMWYVTVWGHSKDPNTLSLIRSFEQNDHLSCFIGEPPAIDGKKRKPWAHFNSYFADDGMQTWRFKNYKIPTTGPFPIVTITAPRNGHFGNPAVVIDRIESSMMKNPKDLNQRITTSVNLWCKKLASDGHIPPKEAIEQFYGVNIPEGAYKSTSFELKDSTPKGGFTQSRGFPWGPDAPPKQPQVNPQFPINGPAADPIIPTGTNLWDWLNESPGVWIVILLLLKAIEMLFPGPVAALAKFLEGLIPQGKKPSIPDGFVLVPKDTVKRDTSLKE